MQKSDSLGKLAEALAKAQGMIAGAKKDEANPFYKSKYADLASVWESCREPLARNGLAVIQTTEFEADRFILRTILAHASGEWIASTYPLNPVKNDPQGMGSAVSYARRYALAAMVGVYSIDDDGNEASSSLRGVRPEEPDVGDGYREEGVIIPYGPLAKQLVHKANPAALRTYIQSIELKAKETGKPIPKWAEPVIQAAEPVIAAFENQTSPSFQDFKG